MQGIGAGIGYPNGSGAVERQGAAQRIYAVAARASGEDMGFAQSGLAAAEHVDAIGPGPLCGRHERAPDVQPHIGIVGVVDEYRVGEVPGRADGDRSVQSDGRARPVCPYAVGSGPRCTDVHRTAETNALSRGHHGCRAVGTDGQATHGTGDSAGRRLSVEGRERRVGAAGNIQGNVARQFGRTVDGSGIVPRTDVSRSGGDGQDAQERRQRPT